jgi:hypothetical protein
MKTQNMLFRSPLLRYSSRPLVATIRRMLPLKTWRRALPTVPAMPSKKTADTLKETGDKVENDVTERAKEVAAPASAKAQELLDSAKSLIGEGKLQDAFTKLKALSGEKLSAEQQA